MVKQNEKKKKFLKHF